MPHNNTQAPTHGPNDRVCPSCGRSKSDSRTPCPDCPPAPAAANAGPRVVDAEVLPDTDNTHDASGTSSAGGMGFPARRDTQTHGDNSFESGRSRLFGQNFSRNFNPGGFTFIRFGNGATDKNSCLLPLTSLLLFIVCLFQYGVLAAIGFGFFHLAGSAALGVFTMRQLMQGRQPDPRLGQVLVRIAAFLLAGWLSGGLD